MEDQAPQKRDRSQIGRHALRNWLIIVAESHLIPSNSLPVDRQATPGPTTNSICRSSWTHRPLREPTGWIKDKTGSPRKRSVSGAKTVRAASVTFNRTGHTGCSRLTGNSSSSLQHRRSCRSGCRTCDKILILLHRQLIPSACAGPIGATFRDRAGAGPICRWGSTRRVGSQERTTPAPLPRMAGQDALQGR